MTQQPRIIIREDTGLFRLATRPPMPHDIPHDEFTEHYVEVPSEDGSTVRFLHVYRICKACGVARISVIVAPKGQPSGGGEIRWKWPGESALREVMPVCVGVTG